MIQFQVTKDFGNPLLPVSKARSELYLSSALAIYEMRSTKESSGNGKALEVNGLTFDSEGLICDGIDGHYADTGIIEPLENTVIMAFRADKPGATSQFYSSLAEGTRPYTGTRAAVTKDGFFVADVGIHVSEGGAYTGRAQTGDITPGWEIVAVVTSAKGISVTRMTTGGSNYGLFDSRTNPKNTVRIGGGYIAPHNLGIVGRIGLWAMYTGAMNTTTVDYLLEKARGIMAGKGVIIQAP